MKTMKTMISVAILAMSACMTDQHTAHTDLTAACGPIPSEGNYSYSYTTRDGVPVAVLPRADFDSLAQERHDLKEWAYCALDAVP